VHSKQQEVHNEQRTTNNEQRTASKATNNEWRSEMGPMSDLEIRQMCDTLIEQVALIAEKRAIVALPCGYEVMQTFDDGSTDRSLAVAMWVGDDDDERDARICVVAADGRVFILGQFDTSDRSGRAKECRAECCRVELLTPTQAKKKRKAEKAKAKKRKAERQKMKWFRDNTNRVWMA